MKDSRFIELLNLYVDGQIGSAEAAELEAEVLRDPARRHTYDQYCRLQRACSLLGDGARLLAPASTGFARSLRDAERKIAAPRTSPWRPAYVGVFSATAMAACVAVILVVNRPTPLPNSIGEVLASPRQPIASTEKSTPMVAAVGSATPVASSASFDLQPMLVAAVARNAREAEIAANDRAALEWMQRVDLLPIQRIDVDEQAFETRATLHQDNRVFRSRHSIRDNAEFAVFQFQR